MITLRNGAVIGGCGYTQVDRHPPEIGYWLGVKHWGKGYATEAVRAMIDHIFADIDFDAIQAAARVTNPASRRVLEKCGFQWSSAGLLRIRAIASSAPIDRFRLDRGLWASLKSWGQSRRVRGVSGAMPCTSLRTSARTASRSSTASFARTRSAC